MTLCNAQSFAATAGAPNPAMQHGGAMVMHAQPGGMADHAAHGAANMAHDCCDDASNSPCCGAAEALKTKSTADIDLQAVTFLLSWLWVIAEPTLPALPSVNTINSHAVIPRLHLLLCVFLD